MREQAGWYSVFPGLRSTGLCHRGISIIFGDGFINILLEERGMGIISLLKDRHYASNVQEMTAGGDFNGALGYAKKISSMDLKKKAITMGLLAYAATQAKPGDEIHITENRQEYDQFTALVEHPTVKYLLWINPETGNIESGLEKFIQQTVDPQNPLVQYLDQLP